MHSSTTKHCSLTHLRAGLLKTGISAVAIAACAAVGVGAALAKGGTAKPPGGGGGGGGVPAGACPSGAPATAACIIPPAGPVLPNFPAPVGAITGNGSNGFSVTGFIQDVQATCNNPTAGGSLTVNGLQITVPSDSIIQYPANTLTWTDAVCGQPAPLNLQNQPIALNGTGGTGTPIHPGVEISIEGNIVAPAGAAAGIGSPYVAGIIHISQQSLNSGSGYIQAINFGDAAGGASLVVASNGGQTVTLKINDPKGRFGSPGTALDARFMVDDANPTIKAGATGYPMCIPRSANDPRCPQKNRPQNSCRNFASTNLVLPGGDLPTTPPAGSTYCAGFVMYAIKGMPGTGSIANANTVTAPAVAGPSTQAIVLDAAGTTGPNPDPREQAPFEVGDFITWSGTLVNTGSPTTDIIWVHTIDANVGIYTQPATLPAYIAIGENGIGVDPTPTGGGAIVGVEATARIFMEAGTSDVASVVDIYYDDKGFSLGANGRTGPLVPDAAGANPNEFFRWITPESMTGTVADQVAQAARAVAIPQASTRQAGAFGGGIYTQFIGPQPGRARIRANKVPAINATLACPVTGPTVSGTRGCAVTQSPTRYIRAVLRSLCAPAASATASEAGFTAIASVPSVNLDSGAAGAAANSGAFFDINGQRASLPLAGTAAYTGTGLGAVPPSDTSCLQSAQYANGLFSGQYMAPVGEYIFPENTLAGFKILPYNFWHLGFMAYGENGRDGNSTAPQVPQPW